MSELVTLITCTGQRPEAFALCQKYVERQTYAGPIQWLIIDDGDPQLPKVVTTRKNISVENYIGPRKWEPELNTHRFNMEAAIPLVKGNYVFFVEDDDWYAPTFLETSVKLLQHFHIVGEGNAKYYHIGMPGHKEMYNKAHASLASTGMRKAVLPALTRAVNSGELYFDIVLWREAHDTRIPCCIYSNSQLSIGIKGMPGRAGIGAGHKQKDYFLDPSHTTLIKWLGMDSKLYEPFMRPKFIKPVKKETK